MSWGSASSEQPSTLDARQHTLVEGTGGRVTSRVFRMPRVTPTPLVTTSVWVAFSTEGTARPGYLPLQLFESPFPQWPWWGTTRAGALPAAGSPVRKDVGGNGNGAGCQGRQSGQDSSVHWALGKSQALDTPLPTWRRVL